MNATEWNKLTEAVVKAYDSIRSLIGRNTARGLHPAECQKDLWITDLVSREVDANLPVIPGIFSFFSSLLEDRADLYFEEENIDYLRRTMCSSFVTGSDICHVTNSLICALGYTVGSRTPKDILCSLFYWTILAHQDRWVPTLKYHKDWLFVHYADLVNREYPEAPSFPINKPGTIWFGSQQRFILKKLRSKDLTVLNSILQGLKKGMLPVSDNLVIAAAHKHKRILTTVQEPLSEDMLEAIQRTAQECFGQIELQDLNVRENEAISSHSCVESTRSLGGFNGWWLRETYGKYASSIIGLMRDFKYSTDLRGFRLIRGIPVGELRSPSDLVSDSLHERLFYAYNNETPSPVRVKFILEPLKVRTISCGSYFTYACQSALQKKMWKCLQKFSCFILTGTPIDCGVVQKVVAGKWEAGELLVSGDYSSATDLLKLEATLSAMYACMSPDVMQIAYQALGPQLLEYYGPKWVCKLGLEERKAELPTPGYQANGQLMGSPLSFPFLCLINAAIFRFAYENWHGTKIDLKDLPALINGDDIGFRCTWEFYEYWRHVIQQVGFQPSVGKNFTSETFININSQYFRCDTVGDIHYVAEQVPYVNMGLIMGRGKGDTLDEVGFEDKDLEVLPNLLSTQQAVAELVSGHTERVPLILGQWIENHTRILEKYPVGLYSSGYRILPGPSTELEARCRFYLEKVRYGKVSQAPWMGQANDSQMGSFWKPFTTYIDEESVRRDLVSTMEHYKRSERFTGAWDEKAPQPDETKEILLGGVKWSGISSTAAAYVTAEMGNYDERIRQFRCPGTGTISFAENVGAMSAIADYPFEDSLPDIVAPASSWSCWKQVSIVNKVTDGFSYERLGLIW